METLQIFIIFICFPHFSALALTFFSSDEWRVTLFCPEISFVIFFSSDDVYLFLLIFTDTFHKNFLTILNLNAIAVLMALHVNLCSLRQLPQNFLS